jgi:zinc protease
MRKIPAILFFVVALLMSHTTFAQVKVAPINFKERVLANGMRIVTYQDNSSPSVTIQVWYNVGSKNDPPKRNGFAHLFEHIMFKSTKNMKSEQMDRMTEDVGGFNNASTSDDVTNYYEVVPSNHLERLIWAEAERMTNLTVDEANFKSERAVVEEEYRQSVLANPYGQFYEAIQKELFNVHPYKRTTIGTLEDLDSATVPDVQNFHKTYYRPDNASLIIVGDFEQSQLDAWVDKYFGKLQRPSLTIPRVTEIEPERTKEKRVIVKAPNVPLPAVAITYFAPPAKDKDIPALEIASAILSGGESSRLYKELVRNQQIAQEASFSVDAKTDKGLMYFTATLASGKTPEMAEKSLLAELKKIQMMPVTASELTKAKNGMVASKVNSLETNDGKAFQIGSAIILQGDPNAVNRELDELQAVTIADVQRVMKKYFTDTNRVVIYYINDDKENAK